MPKARLDADLVDAIKSAPSSETHEVVAERLGVSVGVVRKYRRLARQDREEVAREVIARHVESTVNDALEDLNRLRHMAAERYEQTKDPRHGTLWLGAVKTTLEHVKPDDGVLDAAIEAELAAASAQPQGRPTRAAQGAEQSPAYH